MTSVDPENLLLSALQIDGELMGRDAANEARHFVEFGECGLAYDVLVFEMKKYAPSPEAPELIKRSALAMGLVFPELSTR